MRDEGALDLGCAHAMTRHVQDIVDAAGDPVVTVLVAPRAVAREILAGELTEVGVEEALMIAVDRAHLSRPTVEHAEIADGLALADVAFVIADRRLDAEERQCRGAGLERSRTGQRCQQDAAGLGLPPGIDNRAAAVADHVVIPLPGFRIDRLTDRAEQAKALSRATLDRGIAVAHERTDCRRGRVENIDVVLVDDLPEAARVRVVRHALEHERRRAVRERPVDDVAVTRNPAHICGAPVNVPVVIIEDVLVRHGCKQQVAGRGMQNAFRLTRRPRRIKNE